MGIGKHNPEDNNKETENTLSPLTIGDPEKAAHNDKPEFSSPHTNGVTEEDAYYVKQGIWQKLKSTKVPLILVLVIIPILLVAIFVAAIAPRRGEQSTKNTEKPVYRYAECEDDWIYSKGKCYYFSDKSGTWNSSQNFCKSQNSSLAIIDDKEELNLLHRLKGTEHRWIGLSREKNVSDWVWTNGTPYTETIFKIGTLEQAPDILECAFLNGNVIKSERGTEPKRWICNKKLVHPTK